MNLHAAVSGYIGAINPNQFVQVRSSVGNTENADGTLDPVYATPGAFAASIGGAFAATADGTTLDVSSVITGSLQPGDAVSGSDGTNSLPPGCEILQQVTGSTGGVGTYELSAATASGSLDQCTVTSASTVLNVSSVSSGVIQIGQDLADTGALKASTLVTGQMSGPGGGAGLYSLNQQQTVAPETMTTSMTIVAQVQAQSSGDLRHTDAINLQGDHRVLYSSFDIRGIVRVTLRGGDMVVLPDGSTWLVQQPIEPFYSTAGWAKVLITRQNGS